LKSGKAAAALSLLAACLARSASADTRHVDYLYVEANEGDSSGGHVALRVGADAFHFQQDIGNLIRMRRDDAEVFHFRYAMLGNRAIHASRIAVSDESYALLRDGFTRRLLVQTAQYGRADVLQDDVDLFALWSQRLHAEPAVSIAVRAAGYFLPDGFPGEAPDAERSPALGAVAAAIAQAHGNTFIADRAASVRAALAAWQPAAVRVPAPALTLDAYPYYPPTASTDYRERIEALTALEVLAAAAPLRSGSFRADVAALDAHERAALAQFAHDLTADLVALAASPRADFGYPLLLGMARLAAIDASLSSGRLVVLDAFAADAPVAPLPDGAQRAAYLGALATQVRPSADQARREFFAHPRFDEADYTQLETTTNRWLEVEEARQHHTPIRTERGMLLPARTARRADLVAPPLAAAATRAELAAARAALADHRARLAELYGYNLITRNCVSEIFTTIDAALAGESRQRLGGTVRTDLSLNFIPIVSSGAVARSYATVGGVITRPSYRQLSLAALSANESAWRVSLRESNTLTSTIYHPGPRDSSFLFFTDDRPALRPLLGVANLLVGLADSALGLATWPADDGTRLRAGLRGALFSLPELAFVNIRKGSMAWVEPAIVSALPRDEPWGLATHSPAADP
jgi:hypothetical protein